MRLRAGVMMALCAVLLLTPLGRAQQSSLAARRAKLRDATDQEWQWSLRTNPELATEIGDPRYNDRWSDYSAAAQERNVAHEREEIRIFEAIDTAGFPEQESLNKTLMLRTLREAGGGESYKIGRCPWIR